MLNFDIANENYEFIRENEGVKELLNKNISKERIGKEITTTYRNATNPMKFIQYLFDTNLLPYVFNIFE